MAVSTGLPPEPAPAPAPIPAPTIPLDPAPADTGIGDIRMTNAEFNAKLAGHKRGLQRELVDARAKAQAFDVLKGQVSELLESGIIDGVEDLDDFRAAAATTLEQHQSEKEAFERDQTALNKRLNTAELAAKDSRAKYDLAMVERSIIDASADIVVDGPGREGAVEYFQLKLGQLAEVQPNGDVLVKWAVEDETTGRTEEKLIPVVDALKSMEANPSKYGRNFRSTVNGGAGGETVDGVKRTADGGVDFANMDFSKFRELATKDPALFNAAANKLEF